MNTYTTNTTTDLSGLVRHLGITAEAQVITFSDGSTNVALRWSDGLANTWEETFGSLSSAMARLAILAYCGEDEWNTEFVSDGLEFVQSFDNWAYREVI